MEEGGRRGPWGGLMCLDLSVESSHAEVYGSELTNPALSYAGLTASVADAIEVISDVARPRCRPTPSREPDLSVIPLCAEMVVYF